MSQLQKVTKSNKPTPLPPAKDEYVSYVAVSGLIVADDGTFTKMTVDEFATKVGVTRKTLAEWKKTIPNFEDLVEKRRTKLMRSNRVSAIWKAMTLKAAAGNVEAAKLVLGQYAKWQPPAQKHDVKHELGNTWSALAAAKMDRNVVEGEVVDDGDNNSGGVQQASQSLPRAS